MATIYVSTTGNNANSGTSPASPKATIAGGLSAAVAGDTVLVAAGTYSGNVVSTKGGSSSGGYITIKSETKHAAIISGNNSTSNQSAVELNHQYLRVQDFTITGTTAGQVRNGVLVAADNVEVVGCQIHNICQFLTGGTSWQGGAGIDFSGPSRTNILINGNLIYDIGLASSTQQLVHGIYCGVHGTNFRITNNVIWDCEDFGVHPYDETEASGIQIINNTIVGTGRGILQAPNGITRNNIVFNVTGRHYDIRGTGNSLGNNHYGGTGTGSTTSTGMLLTNVDPKFVNAAADDYRLQSTSPALNVGTTSGAPTTDLLGVTRPQGSGIDLGAYELQTTVTPPPPTPTPSTFPYAATYPDGVAYPTIAAGTTTVNVSTSAALTTALAGATPGQRIVLASGTYSGTFTVSSKAGTSTAGISIEAASTGGATFAAGSTFLINNSSYVTLKGLSFPYELTSGNTVALRGGSNRCRVTRCLFGPSSVGTPGANKTPFVFGSDSVEHIRVDHNEFRNKANPGNAILFDGNFTTNQACKHIRIDHNVIQSIKPEVTNEKEPIRLGVSSMSKTFSYSVIERNFFLDCICEPEVVSVKACGVRVSGNTVLRSIGGIVYRHGTNGIVTDNHIVDRVNTFGTTIGSGGFRFYDANHVVSNNYVDSVFGGNFQNAITIDSGDAEGSSTALDAHWRVVNATVERNVLVGSPTGIVIGHNYSLAPTGCTIRDNVVAQAASGTAITQKIAPVSTTITGNLYGSTPGAVSLAQGPDTIWRRVDYGPRLTYLQPADVGIAGDPNDTDGTGTLIGAGGTGGTADPTTAAGKFGWGQPLDVSDEFSYTGAPNSSKWSVYNGVGHDGNGRRLPTRVTVDGTTLVGTGLSNGDSFGMAHRFNQQYGRWEVRMRCYQNAASNGNDYHTVFIIWPESDRWPEDGEYDFVELSVPGQQTLGAFIHYPHDASVSVQQEPFTKNAVDTAQFHNYAIEWTPDWIKGFLDGNEWFTVSGGANSIRRNIQDMPSGHLTIQLDNFDGTNQTPATVEVQWARVYTLTPTGPVANPMTLGVAGIPTREAIGTARVTVASAPDVPVPPPANSVPTLLGQNTVLGAMTLGWTLTTGGPGPGAQLITGAGRIGTGQAFGLPALTVPPGDQVISPSGIPPTTVFGISAVSGGTPPPAAPGGVLVPALYAVGRDTETLTPLPHWQSIKITPVRNSMGTLEVAYPAGAPGFDLLHDGVSASPLRALEIRIWLGGNNTAAVGGWLVQKSGDDLVRDSVWTFSGHLHEWLLSKAIIYPQAISEANKSGALTFAGATAGLIFTTMMDQAQARGALPYVVRDFTATHDSNGQPWANSISSLKLSPKTTLLQVAEKLVELGMCEFELTPARMWRAYNAAGRGVDRSTGSNPLTFAQLMNLRERARRESARDAGTAVLVAGAEGFYAAATSPTAERELGWRAEVGMDAGQLNSASAVQAVLGSYLNKARAGVAEYAAGVEFSTPGQLPLIDYGVGDWALLRVGTSYERQRIVQIELEFANDGRPRGSVEFNDLITDRIVALNRRLNAISTGDAVVGTSESTPGGTGDDIIPPAAPEGLTVASTLAYQIPGEATTLAEVSAGWAPVTTNAYADTETAGRAKAAPVILVRLAAGLPVLSNWTWDLCPAIVTSYGPALAEEWKSDPANPGNDTTNTVDARVWLQTYPDDHLGGGAITNDIDHYVVQFAYLGATGVTTEDPVGQDPSIPRVPGIGWGTPDNSETTSTTIVFGGVAAGRSVGVRVSAVDRSGNQGPWSDVVAVLTAVDDQPPPVPSKPIATAWFRTMDVFWDGKGAAGEDMFLAAPDFASGGGVEVHVGQGIDFTPDRPLVAGVVDLAASSTYKATLYSAGTWNVTDLSYGVTYYARLVAVDRNGNASEPSETSDGVLPRQLVQIDLGPDAVGRLQIIDGEIVRAKIADLAVNDAKIEEINVGKLRTGTMTAQVAVAGRFSTPMSNNNHLEFDSAGIRLYQGNVVVGRWQVFDASMLVTGAYMSAPTGQRVVINPGGSQPDTIRFYPTFTDAFSSIDSVDFNGGTTAGIRIVGSGTSSVANRGMVVVRDQFVSLVHGRTDLSYWGSEIWAEQSFTRMKSATVDLIIDDRLTPVLGTRRVSFLHYDTAGQPVPSTHMQYNKGTDGRPWLWGVHQNSGLKFDLNGLAVTTNNSQVFGPISASAFLTASSATVKNDIRPISFRGGLTSCDVIERVPSRQWTYNWSATSEGSSEEVEQPLHRFPVAEDLAALDPSLVRFGGTAGISVDQRDLLGVLWDAVRTLIKEVRQIDNPPPEDLHVE